MGRPLPLLLALALLSTSASCADDPAGQPAPADPFAVAPDPAEAACAELDVDNVLDRALCPELQGQTIAPDYADTGAICRRMAIDVAGRLPTAAEVDGVCRGATPEAIAQHFMDQPGYFLEARRRWSDRFEFTDVVTWPRYIAELDALVMALHEGELDAREFAVQAMVAPAFTGRYFGEMRVARAFQIFLGRDALPAERADLDGLWNLWLPVPTVDPDVGYETFSIVAALGFCGPPLDELLCHSSLYGEREIFLDVPNPDVPDAPENFVDVAELTAAQWAVLRSPGELLTSLPTFDEHTVHHTLERLLGWPAHEALPHVAQALVDFFVGPANRLMPALELEILTSTLYLQTRTPGEEPAPDASAELSRWRYSPVKQLPVEVWMDGLQAITGASIGWCDQRYPFVQRYYDPGTGETRYAPNDYPTVPGPSEEPDPRYAEAARRLGGCPDRLTTFRFEGTGAMHALAQEQFIQATCYSPGASRLLPGTGLGGAITSSRELGSDPASLAALYRHQVTRFFGRDALDVNVDAFVAATTGCEQSGDCDLDALPQALCEALAKSAEYLYY